MKCKKIILILSMASILLVGCSSSKGTDSIVIDGDTQKTVSLKQDLKVSKIMEVEGVGFGEGSKTSREGYILDINGKVISYFYNHIDDLAVQFQKQNLQQIKVGTITNEKVDGKNKIQWKDEKVEGRLLTEYMPAGYGVTRILKDGKVYSLNEEGELKEISAYEKVVKRLKDDINRFETHLDGRIDCYSVGGGEIGIVDTLENKYYTFNLKNIEEIKEKSLKIIGIEEGKVYIASSSIAPPYETEVGYLKDNKYTKVVSKKDGIDISIRGDAFYRNGKILFSGYSEGKNGIWKYDVEKKVFSKVLEVGEDRFYRFSLNKSNDKIALTSQYHGQSGQYKESLIIGNIDDNFEVASLQNVISNDDINNTSDFVRWNESKDEFYVEKREMPTSDSSEFKLYYEVYEAK